MRCEGRDQGTGPKDGYRARPMPEHVATKRLRLRTPNNRTTTEFRISVELWAVLQPVLPIHRTRHGFGGGRPRVSDDRCAAATIFVLRTGGQWKTLDAAELCARCTARDRFQEWVAAGVFLCFWQTGVGGFAELRGIDWGWLSLDGAVTNAPWGGGTPGANLTDRGKRSKRSLLTESMRSVRRGCANQTMTEQDNYLSAQTGH